MAACCGTSTEVKRHGARFLAGVVTINETPILVRNLLCRSCWLKNLIVESELTFKLTKKINGILKNTSSYNLVPIFNYFKYLLRDEYIFFAGCSRYSRYLVS